MAEELRIGVFVCRCGTNIAGFLDTENVAEYAKTLPNVVFTRENLFSCSEAGVTDIKNAITANKLNRVVVAACTPLTHEPTFRAACEDAGLNPYLFEFVNIREQCSWVHKTLRQEATQKAKDLIRMGVARASLLEPMESIVTDVIPSALVIGGGIAGLTAALALANRGFEVKLVERQEELGGMLRNLHQIYPYNLEAREFINSKIKEVEKNAEIEILTGHSLEELHGFIGNYQATVASSDGSAKELKIGVIIVATGASLLVPEGSFNYNGKDIIDQLQLEERLRDGAFEAQNVVMIKCVGARVKERLYCSRICCMTAIKDGILIKKKNPDANVHILYRDLMCYGVANEEMLRQAKELGVRFVNYSLARPPIVEEDKVKVHSDVLGRDLELESDLVVLVTPLIPREGATELSKLLKVPLDEYKFFLEAHVKLRPNDFATEGIYICGSAHWPVSTGEAIQQALGAASRASIHLTNKKVKVEPIVSMLFDEEACRGCGLCASLCPYAAIEMVETEKGIKAKMIEVACKGCGVCAASCYKQAIKMNHYSNEQLTAQIRVAFQKKEAKSGV
jgi:heterodisulfide reductase subunit A